MIKSYNFKSLTSSEIKERAVMEIKKSNDLHSPKLGALVNTICETCN